MYKHLSQFYENPVLALLAEHTTAFINKRLEEYRRSPPEKILDLACGTGLILSKLAQQGWAMQGVDIEPSMLDIARKRTQAQNLSVDLQQGDIRKFITKEPTPIAICFGDVINHLLAIEDVKQAFTAIKQSLQPGGVFLFDSNTLENYQSSLWNIKDATTDREDGKIIQKAAFDQDTGRAYAETIFEHKNSEKTDGNHTDRISERVYVQYYPNERLEKLLADCGFQEIRQQPYMMQELQQVISQPAKTFWSATRGD